MSLLDAAPIIEQMLLISDNVSDLNFSTRQKHANRNQRQSLRRVQRGATFDFGYFYRIQTIAFLVKTTFIFQNVKISFDTCY